MDLRPCVRGSSRHVVPSPVYWLGLAVAATAQSSQPANSGLPMARRGDMGTFLRRENSRSCPARYACMPLNLNECRYP
jgi:hypothetical protein